MSPCEEFSQATTHSMRDIILEKYYNAVFHNINGSGHSHYSNFSFWISFLFNASLSIIILAVFSHFTPKTVSSLGVFFTKKLGLE